MFTFPLYYCVKPEFYKTLFGDLVLYEIIVTALGSIINHMQTCIKTTFYFCVTVNELFMITVCFDEKRFRQRDDYMLRSGV